MAISFRSAHSADASSVAITTPAAGDVIVVFAFNVNNNTLPTLPAGYTAIADSTGGSGVTITRIAYRISDGTETTSGTWTNASQIVVMIYRGVDPATPIGAFALTNNPGTTAEVLYPTITLQKTDGTSWVVGVGAARAATAGMNGTTTALTTNRTNVLTANGLDTSGPVSTFAGQVLPYTGSLNRTYGWSIEIRAQALISAAAGSIAITGSAASFIRSVILGADAGAMTLTGSALSLFKTYYLAASAGSIAITGSVASFIRSLIWGAGAGAMTLTGSAASFVRALIFLVDAASVALTGSPLGLFRTYYFAADAGSTTLTGSTASFIRSVIFLANAGAVAVTGSTSAFVRSLIFLADAASVALTGSPASLFKTYYFATDAGSVSLTGAAVAFLRTLCLSAAAGVVTLTGMAETFLRSVIFRLGIGSVTLTGSPIEIPHYLTLRDSISVVKVQDGALGATGAAGANGVGFNLSNEAHNVPSLPDGTAPVLTGANGQVKVTDGNTDTTASATIGAATATGCAGTVNTATNTPVAGQPKGYYVVTAMSADTATLDIPITYGATSITLRFSLSKTRSAKGLTIISDRQTISYDGTGALSPSSQTTTFSAQKINTSATVNWTMTQLDGTALTAATYLSAVTGDSVTMSAANFDAARGAQLGVIVIGTVVDGPTMVDKISIVKVAAGATGSTGSTGATGPQGIPASAVLAAQNVLSGIGNRLLIGPTTKLAAAVSSGATSISVDAAVFANGDVILLQTAPGGSAQTEFMAITSAASGSGPFSYNVTRNLDSTTADAWSINDVIVGLGQTGSSFIDLYASRGTKSSSEVGPTVVGNVRNSATFNDWTPRWAVGNLHGLYGYTTDIFGAAFGVPTGAWLKIDPTNGIRIGFNATTKMSVDASGNASFAGDINAPSGTIGGWTIGSTILTNGNITLDSSVLSGSGRIYVGVGAYANTNTALYVDGSGQFSLKNKLTWDGTNLTIATGNVQISPSNGITISGTNIAQSINFASGGGLYNVSGIAVSVAGPGLTELFVGNGYVSVESGTGPASYMSAPSYHSGANQVVGARGAAIADTSGATLAQLETTVNVMKAMLRTHGLIAP